MKIYKVVTYDQKAYTITPLGFNYWNVLGELNYAADYDNGAEIPEAPYVAYFSSMAKAKRHIKERQNPLPQEDH
tara:strand:- start:865 stop:1086 length:222 start_codon:yes stop_codon:yes gene_type:complete